MFYCVYQEAVELTFPHCAVGGEVLSAVQNNSSEEWKVEKSDAAIKSITSDRVTISIKHFTGFRLVGRPSNNNELNTKNKAKRKSLSNSVSVPKNVSHQHLGKTNFLDYYKCDIKCYCNDNRGDNSIMKCYFRRVNLGLERGLISPCLVQQSA